MSNKSGLTLFVTIALAGITAATPFTTIPLAKRNTLTQADSTFDALNAVLSASRTKRKHEQNLLNFQRNVLGVALSGEVRSIFYNHIIILIDIFLRAQSPPSPILHIRRLLQNR